MRTLVVFESMFGNTERVARVVADEFARLGPVTVLNVDDAPSTLDAFDFVVAGAPTHVFGLSRPQTRADAATRIEFATVTGRHGLREWLDIVSPASPDCPAATFGTRAAMPRVITGCAARAARRRLHRAGFRMVGKPGDFRVSGALGPLIDGELVRAGAWARELTDAVAAVGC
ncbi:flavodoxin domain-containing protein [Aldersonia sp. NBC_00410]|uniref:flavodoxin family protein n=1 Tax=Aldersonia sp. NBC_00410 TaxID=2975954 RepID=UPI00225BF807|nr:flavodoxin domain-containing protein [Aldersonia sp. NBC_00410]MCX5046050.1 flavodoxin domain-containing protein [Aldersonia sp. NBC_00410]